MLHLNRSFEYSFKQLKQHLAVVELHRIKPALFQLDLPHLLPLLLFLLLHLQQTLIEAVVALVRWPFTFKFSFYSPFVVVNFQFQIQIAH